MPDRIAYLPLDTHPEAASSEAIRAALDFAAALGCGVHATTFAVKMPPVASPIGGGLINIGGMARDAENRSRTACERLQALVEGAAEANRAISGTTREVDMGGAVEAATAEARYFDLALAPWSAEAASLRDMAQALVFDAGVPVILLPPEGRSGPVDHLAVAWDESRVAARALGDALGLLAPGGRVSVLTVEGEKAIGGGLSKRLAAALQRRGYEAAAVDLALEGRSIAGALQDAALAQGAGLLAMGGFGHSRLRDFILGGATKGVFADLRLPVLLSH
jgi:nucleotide-binding universal stress UspA family protein